jgi:hypothetical protein
MNITIRSSEEADVGPGRIAQQGTLTLVSGTGSFIAPVEWLQALATAPDGQAQLQLAVEALAEEEAIDLMVSLGPSITGIDNTLWFTPTPAHGPRIKVAINPAHAKRSSGVVASVPFDAPAVGDISPALEQRVRAFIALNEAVLREYWALQIFTDELIRRLKPVAG